MLCHGVYIGYLCVYLTSNSIYNNILGRDRFSASLFINCKDSVTWVSNDMYAILSFCNWIHVIGYLHHSHVNYVALMASFVIFLQFYQVDLSGGEGDTISEDGPNNKLCPNSMFATLPVFLWGFANCSRRCVTRVISADFSSIFSSHVYFFFCS